MGMSRKFNNGYTPIHVIGVGRLGCDLVSKSYDQMHDHVTCSVCSYQYFEVYGSKVPRKLLLENGDPFLTSFTDENAGNLSVGCRERLHELIREKTDVVIIVADMSDVVGRNVASIIAQKARAKAKIVLGFVCVPGGENERCADDGVEAFRQNVDAILCCNMDDAEGVLQNAVETLYAVFCHISQIDLKDCKKVLCDGRYAVVTNRKGRGERRVDDAISAIKSSVLGNGWNMKDFDKVIFLIYTSHEHEFHVDELEHVDILMEELDLDVDFAWGMTTDDTLKDEINFSFIASAKK